MKKLFVIAAATLCGIATPAFAQDDAPASGGAQVYGGVTAGWHDLGALPTRDDGGIYGAVIGVDVPVGDTLIVGVEADYSVGTGAIDQEYGITAKLGARIGEKGQVFLRGGWREVDIDLPYVVGGPVGAGFDSTDDDYMLGVGGQVRLSDNVSLRVTADTIAFDTTRLTGGLIINF